MNKTLEKKIVEVMEKLEKKIDVYCEISCPICGHDQSTGYYGLPKIRKQFAKKIIELVEKERKAEQEVLEEIRELNWQRGHLKSLEEKGSYKDGNNYLIDFLMKLSKRLKKTN